MRRTETRLVEPRTVTGRGFGPRAPVAVRHVPMRVVGARESLRFDGLYEYQIEGVRFLTARNRAILGDEPGLGKTAQALRAIDNSPAVVIAPAMLAEVWRAQAARWRPDLRVEMGDGGRPRSGRVDVYSYDYRGAVPCVDSAVVVIDEAHFLRHHEIARSERWAYVRDAQSLWLLTGTPVVSTLDDLTQLYNLLGVDPAGDFILRRTVADVDLQLPTRVYDTLPVVLSHDLYHVLSILNEEWKDVQKLPPLERMTEARLQLTRAKCNAMLAWVAKYAQNSRCVVYSNYLEPLKMLVAGHLDFGLVTGEMAIDERDAVIAAFDRGRYKGLACSLTAVGVGVSLASADRVLFVDRSWNPGDNEQVERRVCRLGNRNARVFVTDLIAAHPLEERVYQVLRTKQRDIDLVDYSR